MFQKDPYTIALLAMISRRVVCNFWTAALVSGFSVAQDSNNDIVAGVTCLLRALNPDTGTRCYARLGHYERVIVTRLNYHLLAENVVAKVLFEGKKAVGVEARAKKEVNISAGAGHTPQILQLSGVGPSSLLEAKCIEVLVGLQDMDSNFHDQLNTKVNYNFTPNLSPNARDLDTNSTYNIKQQCSL
ncbi:hypothetical protein BJ878DRAFT_482309 [Calycina marina]|uniref:Glucose-methanol-choline oxidoreductase N-terminal domain-containing protein n=1 Tax=Calycina marina TaxID=1763456 RepID=A0A9P7YYE8_9HELO|nr:hypothetical protein BJ878DRAFT_482309 [Calycina marina]